MFPTLSLQQIICWSIMAALGMDTHELETRIGIKKRRYLLSQDHI